ncbi:MAG: group II intron reverse transcriptase/maturase [Firmicutes bacterium]|nr:group II intron reverse transcriptase/maturase [Bacillota bacterium]
MNEPLKHKLFTVYGQLLNTKVLNEAWKHVKANKGCAGVDKVSIRKFDENAEEYIQSILEELKKKEYKPSPVARKYIPKKNGKRRPLGIPTIKDRVIQQALVSRLEPFFEENVFHDNSCGFRPGRDVELALKKVLSRIEYGYTFIYDFDIKGYFDNIPHKRLMRVLNKYISDGTVLDMIWKWLKAGYMEDEIRYEQTKGVQQGGVISPLLSNIYLNELDWELEKAGHQFVRYADDCIVMCQTQEEYDRAKELVKKVLTELGLEIAEDKTKDIDFYHDDFDFLGFSFRHIRNSKSGNPFYILTVREKSIKEFRSEMKAKIKKSYTYSFEKWKSILNPIIRGKVNYYLKAAKAVDAVEKAMKAKGGRCRCKLDLRFLKETDGYIRNRLRVAFANRGRKSARYVDGKLLTVKYGNSFFLKNMGLESGRYMYWKHYHPEMSKDEFLKKTKKKSKYTGKKDEFFRYALAR